jgi:hypothetical protein
MAIVKATYTKLHKAIKASVAYYTTRPTRAGTRGQRILFGKDGRLSKKDVETMLRRMPKGTYFYRIVLSPDPKSEDRDRMLSLESLTRRALSAFAQKKRRDLLDYAAVCHTDHTPHRHVHVVACFEKKLTRSDLFTLCTLTTRLALGLRIDEPIMEPTPVSTPRYNGVSAAKRATKHRSSPKRSDVVFHLKGGIAPSRKQQAACTLCGQSAKLVWQFGALRCSNCGFAVKRQPTKLVQREQGSGETLELSLTKKHPFR